MGQVKLFGKEGLFRVVIVACFIRDTPRGTYLVTEFHLDGKCKVWATGIGGSRNG